MTYVQQQITLTIQVILILSAHASIRLFVETHIGHASMARFSKQQIKKQITKHYPGCPEFASNRVTELVLARDWWDMSPAGAVAIVIESVLRHNMTEYERLLYDGVARDEARRRVQWKVDRMIAEWKKKQSSRNDLDLTVDRIET